MQTPKTVLLFLTVAALCATALVSPAVAQCDQIKLMADTPAHAGTQGFGFSLDLDGGWALIGRPDGHIGGVRQGTVSVRDGSLPDWPETDLLFALDGAAGDRFGSAVALRGDVALIGAPGDETAGFDSGAAYVFRRNGGVWSQEAKLVPTPSEPGDRFGYAVALGDGVLVIGAPYADPAGLREFGRAYVFRYDGEQWSQETALRHSASPAVPYARFGRDVALDGDLVAVGTTGKGADLFRFDGSHWALEAAFAFPVEAQQFGRTVDVEGDTFVVGAIEVSWQGGHAYVFVDGPGGWALDANLRPLDGHQADSFGCDLDLAGDVLVVGALNHDLAGHHAGAADVFSRAGGVWTHQRRLMSVDARAIGELGLAVATDGTRALVGDPRDEQQGIETRGAVYVFPDLSPTSAWSSLGNGFWGTHGAPCLEGTGAIQAGESVTLELSGALENTTAGLVVGVLRLDLDFMGGVMVPAPDLLVLGLPTGPAGALLISDTVPGDVIPGVELFMQLWVTDPAAPVGFSASNALTETTQ